MIVTKNIYITLLALVSIFIASCAEDRLEPELETADGGGTLTSYTAYAIDSIPGQGTNVYGRAVFWESPEFGTLLQISLYGIMEGNSHPAAVVAGSVAAPGAEIMSLYTIENTGEGYAFGEFSTSKFYTISTAGFYEGLDSYDGNIQISLSSSDNTIVASGDIGLNATPVETN